MEQKPIAECEPCDPDDNERHKDHRTAVGCNAIAMAREAPGHHTKCLPNPTRKSWADEPAFHPGIEHGKKHVQQNQLDNQDPADLLEPDKEHGPPTMMRAKLRTVLRARVHCSNR